MTRFPPFCSTGLLVALAVFVAACGQPSTPDEAVPSSQDTLAASGAEEAPPIAAVPDTAAVDLRPATSAEVLAFTRDGAAPLTIVNFWATWCVPCIVEFPALVRAEAALRPEGVRLVFVSVDDLADRAGVLKFLARHGVTGPSFQKNEAEDPFISAFSETWSGTLPATFVYDRDGDPAAYFDRPVTFETITDTARALLRTSSL